MAEVALIARATVAMAFILTGLWKLVHPLRFQVAFRAVAPALARYASWATALLIICEFAAAALLLVPRYGNVGAVWAAFLLSAFTIALWRRPNVRGGCGCWRSGSEDDQSKSLILVRNAVLLLFVLVGAAPGRLAQLDFGTGAFASITGCALAVLLLELPHVGTVARAQPQGRSG